jgi:hypothetical protein
MKQLLAACLFSLASVAVSAQTIKPPVRVYVWTARPAAIVGLDQKGRDDSVADIVRLLQPSKALQASTEEASEIQVEVVKRERVPTGAILRYFYGPVPETRPTLYVTLRFRDYRVDLTCADTPPMAYAWKEAAEACVKQFTTWTRLNISQIRPDK